MALTGKVMGTSDRTKVRFFRANEALRIFGSVDREEIRDAVVKSARQLAEKPSRILVDTLHYGILISWYWARWSSTTATVRRAGDE